MSRNKSRQKKRHGKKEDSQTIGAPLVIIAVIVVVAIVAALALMEPASPTDNGNSGLDDGNIVVTEFFSFYCSHCYNIYPLLPPIFEKYEGNNVSVNYMPMNFVGTRLNAIEAYIIAKKMGKGEEMKKAIFEAQFANGLDVDDVAILESLASDIGLGSEFNAQLESDSAKADALANNRAFSNSRLDSTPTIIIKGKGKTIVLTPADAGGNTNDLAQKVDAAIASLV